MPPPGSLYRLRTPRATFRLMLCALLTSSVYTTQPASASPPHPRQPPRTHALLLVEYEAVKGVAQVQHLVRYRFRGGEMISRDTILTTKTEDVRYDLGANHVYQNRYVVTNWADVIDASTKTLLRRGDGEFVAFEGGRVIERVSKAGAGEQFFAFDLITRKRARLESGKWVLPGHSWDRELISPDGLKRLELWNTGIRLHTADGERRLLGDAFGGDGGGRCSDLKKPPAMWLDSERIVTQRADGRIVVLHTDGAIEPVVEFETGKPDDCGASFVTDRERRVVYSVGGRAFAIDVAKKTYAPYEWLAFGHGFYGARESSPQYGQIIKYRDEEIGRCWCSFGQTTEGHVAAKYGPVGSNLGYPKGVKVWSAATGKWTTIDVPWLATIVGWINE